MEYRRSVFRWLKEKWNANVIIPYGEYSSFVYVCSDGLLSPSQSCSLLLINRDKPKLLLSWTIDFSEDGMVVSRLHPEFRVECAGASSLHPVMNRQSRHVP